MRTIRKIKTRAPSGGVIKTILMRFRECGICLNDLEEKLKEETVVYGAAADERFSD